MKKHRNLILIVFVFSTLAGCASHYSSEIIANPYGFFSGLWHGVIAPLTIVVNVVSWFLSLADIIFLQDVQIIGRPNTGIFYYIGFTIGILWSLVYLDENL